MWALVRWQKVNKRTYVRMYVRDKPYFTSPLRYAEDNNHFRCSVTERKRTVYIVLDISE